MLITLAHTQVMHTSCQLSKALEEFLTGVVHARLLSRFSRLSLLTLWTAQTNEEGLRILSELLSF